MTPLDYFSALVGEGDDIPLTEAAIAVAQDAYPRLDVASVQLELDQMAATLRARLPADATAVHKLRTLNRYFFEELHFAGNQNDYYDPDNSYLNRVIERRSGIPISLAVVFMELGQQIGLALRGVSFPGHFLVKLKVRAGDIFLDPFTGQSLSREELEERLSEYLHEQGMEIPVDMALVAAIQDAPPREILARMLRNLKGIYHERQDFEKLLDVQQRLVALLPDDAQERRDRGLIFAQLECPRAALEDLNYYLDNAPSAPEAEEIRSTISVLRDAAGRLN